MVSSVLRIKYKPIYSESKLKKIVGEGPVFINLYLKFIQNMINVHNGKVNFKLLITF